MKEEPKKDILDKYLSNYEDVRIGHMFGYPAYCVGRSMFACLYEGKVGLKLPSEKADNARTQKQITDFKPHGRPKMREWVQFQLRSKKDLLQHKELIETAINYAGIKKK